MGTLAADGLVAETGTLGGGPLSREQVFEIRASAAAYIAEQGITQAHIAKALGVSPALISAYLGGDDVPAATLERLSRQIDAWIDEHVRTRHMRRPGNFVNTAAARLILTAGRMVRATRNIGVVMGPAGVGKTIVAQQIATQEPQTMLVYIDDDCSGYRGFTDAVADAARVMRPKKGHISLRAVIARLRDSGRLLIVDQAHDMTERALHTLMNLHDQADLPVLLLGTRRVGWGYEVKCSPCLPKLSDASQASKIATAFGALNRAWVGVRSNQIELRMAKLTTLRTGVRSLSAGELASRGMTRGGQRAQVKELDEQIAALEAAGKKVDNAFDFHRKGEKVIKQWLGLVHPALAQIADLAIDTTEGVSKITPALLAVGGAGAALGLVVAGFQAISEAAKVSEEQIQRVIDARNELNKELSDRDRDLEKKMLAMGASPSRGQLQSSRSTVEAAMNAGVPRELAEQAEVLRVRFGLTREQAEAALAGLALPGAEAPKGVVPSGNVKAQREQQEALDRLLQSGATPEAQAALANRIGIGGEAARDESLLGEGRDARAAKIAAWIENLRKTRRPDLSEADLRVIARIAMSGEALPEHTSIEAVSNKLGGLLGLGEYIGWGMVEGLRGMVGGSKISSVINPGAATAPLGDLNRLAGELIDALNRSVEVMRRFPTGPQSGNVIIGTVHTSKPLEHSRRPAFDVHDAGGLNDGP